MVTPLDLYTIRIRGRLGATALSAFPSMASDLEGGETVLTGWFEGRSALFGVVEQIEALGLELLELRQVTAMADVATTPSDERVREVSDEASRQRRRRRG